MILETTGRLRKWRRKEQEDEDVIAIWEQMRRDPDTRILVQAALKATPEHIQAVAEMLESLVAEELPDAN